MKVLCHETTTRYYVEFNEAEVLQLRNIGQLPPHCAIPAPMWLTMKEITLTMEMLGVSVPLDDLLKDVPLAGDYEVTERGD